MAAASSSIIAYSILFLSFSISLSIAVPRPQIQQQQQNIMKRVMKIIDRITTRMVIPISMSKFVPNISNLLT